MLSHPAAGSSCSKISVAGSVARRRLSDLGKLGPSWQPYVCVRKLVVLEVYQLSPIYDEQ